MMTTAPYSRKNNGPSNMFMPPPETATAEQPQQQQPFKRCSVPGCPTRGEVDETGTCSAHGTKRKRCKIEGCPNGVVQGGVCVKHGAKRRSCKYPGCDKNTKSHGLCSKHGPARKRCNVPKCSNVAVRAGKCKSHGAYAAECAVMTCYKQAVNGGLCIRHYKDMAMSAATQNVFQYAHMSQMSQAMQAAQGVQGVQPVAGLATMNPTAVGLMPWQMQGMGMPMSSPFLSNQMGMPNQMGMAAQMQMAIPPQMHMSMPYPVNGLPHSMGTQVPNKHPMRKNEGDAGSSSTSSNGDEQSTGSGEDKDALH